MLGDDGAKAKGFLIKLTDKDFVESLYFLLDIMLSDISVSFQQDELFITDVVCNLEQGMLQLVSLKTTHGESYEQFQNKFDEDTHIITCGKSTVPLKKRKANRNSVMMTDELNTDVLDIAVSYMEKRFSALQQPPVSLFEVLDPSQWPVDKCVLLHYGDEEIANLVDHFKPVLTEQELASIPSEWVDLKLMVARRRSESPSRPKCIQNVLSLVKIMMTVSPSTATVEQCFSHMNLIKTNLKQK